MFDLSTVTEKELRRMRSKQRQKETDKEKIQSLKHFACDLQTFYPHAKVRIMFVTVPKPHLAVTSVLLHHVSPTAADRRVKVNLDLRLHGEHTAWCTLCNK